MYFSSPSYLLSAARPPLSPSFFPPAILFFVFIDVFRCVTVPDVLPSPPFPMSYASLKLRKRNACGQIGNPADVAMLAADPRVAEAVRPLRVSDFSAVTLNRVMFTGGADSSCDADVLFASRKCAGASREERVRERDIFQRTLTTSSEYDSLQT